MKIGAFFVSFSFYINMLSKYYTIIIYMLFSVNTLQAKESDSLKIVQLFGMVLTAPDKLDSLYHEANLISKESIEKNIKNIFAYNYSKTLFLTGQLDKADSIANASIEQSGDTLAFKNAKLYNIRATVKSYQNQVEEAVYFYNKSIQILELYENDYQAALIKNNIANLFLSLNEHQQSYNYSKEAYQTLKALKDTIYLPGLTAIYAISALKIDRTILGEKLTEESIELANKYNNPVGKIVGYHAKAEVFINQEKYAEAIQAYETSLGYSQQYQQGHYAMLNKIGLLIANVAAENYEKAIVYGEEASKESTKQGNLNTFFAIKKNLSFAYAGIGDFEKGYQYLKEAQEDYIEKANTESKTKLNELLIKYEAEKSEKKLAEQALALADQKAKNNVRAFWIFVLLSLLLILFIAYYSYRKNQIQKLKLVEETNLKNKILAAIQGEEKERERLASELHDGIASTLTGIRLQLTNEYNQNPSQAALKTTIDQLEKVHDETRRISHNLSPLYLKNKSFSQAIEQFCHENSTALIKINFNDLIQSPFVLDKFTESVIFRSTQELINNVLKHADATECNVQVSILENTLNIMVEDNGKGMDINNYKIADGYARMQNKLRTIEASFSIESEDNNGTLAIINLKL
ncbi:hypothetical protein DNU06_00140 [Putridiphycobacter roseus]|uniref:Uncharacterized protein n=1 Tax=Putridiphycobacter roseus TaxID=2219161 RepID=A0A2W1N100_9FLAO|nr:histidine kinase [Putridiphycobacter roseus]PZE18279.1 hypothetical protein DNU06_00140 [Putridiphycobacter roseus]